MIRKVTKTLWYAVDIDGSGWLHEDKPIREYTYMEWRCDNLHHCPEDLMLDRSIFPPLTWEDEPIELEITVTLELKQSTTVTFKK